MWAHQGILGDHQGEPKKWAAWGSATEAAAGPPTSLRKGISAVGIAQPEASCRRTSHSSGYPQVSQRQMLEDEHSAERRVTMSTAVCSQMPLSWLLSWKFTVRKAIVLTKTHANKCLHKTNKGGSKTAKGRVS